MVRQFKEKCETGELDRVSPISTHLALLLAPLNFVLTLIVLADGT